MVSLTTARLTVSKMVGRAALISLLAGLAASVFATPSVAWEVIGTREVTDRVDHDVINLENHKTYTRLKFCAYRHPIKMHDLDISYQNGGHQEVTVRTIIAPGSCTRAIDLNGVTRDIVSISLVYEEASIRKRRATVRVFAE